MNEVKECKDNNDVQDRSETHENRAHGPMVSSSDCDADLRHHTTKVEKGVIQYQKDIIGNNDSATILSLKEQRKAAKKTKKAERRAQRQGLGDPSAGQKKCDKCNKSVNLLVRCQYEGSHPNWNMVCGQCWHDVSGGVPDGDDAHPHYRYGGLWKNRRAQQKQVKLENKI